MLVNVECALERALGLCGLKELKEKQKEAFLAFIYENDVFVSLSISYGKSIIYEILPLVHDTLKSKKSVKVPCSLFIFTLNVPSDRFTSQDQKSAVIISYNVCITYAWTRALTHSYSIRPLLENY